jgi:hypothetical protein
MPLTPAGLPFRIPQASINPSLRADKPAADGGSKGSDEAPGASGAGASGAGASGAGASGAGASGAGAPAADDARRSPEEVRKLVGSYLSGTFRGRTDAARARQAPAEPPADREPPQ